MFVLVAVFLENNPMIEEWNCDICHEKRPDAKISVLSKAIPYGQHNIKYCNDRPGCLYGAENLELFVETEKEEE